MVSDGVQFALDNKQGSAFIVAASNKEMGSAKDESVVFLKEEIERIQLCLSFSHE